MAPSTRSSKSKSNKRPDPNPASSDDDETVGIPSDMEDTSPPKKSKSNDGKAKASNPKKAPKQPGKPKDDDNYDDDDDAQDKNTTGKNSPPPLGTQKSSSGDDGDDPQAEILKLKQQAQALKEKLNQQSINDKVARKGGRKIRRKEMSREEKQWLNRIYKAVKEYGWNISKFINNDSKLDDATKIIMQGMGYEELFPDLKGDKLKKQKKYWVAMNRDLVRTGFNEARNAAMSNLRNEYVKRMEDGLKVPTPDQLLDCATREPTLMDTEEGCALFDEYVDVWLAKAGLLEHWDKQWRHHLTISEATHEEDRKGECGDKHPCITAGTEAFLVVAIENGVSSRFAYIVKVHKSKDMTYDSKHPEASCPFVNSKGGVLKWGGWNDLGQERFKEIRQKVKDGRARDHVAKMEADSLKRIRIKHGIDPDPNAPTVTEKKKKVKAKVYDDSDNEFGDFL